MKRLYLILGDQLHADPHPLLADFDAARDRLLMVEAPEESTHVWSHKARSALFLAAMRQRAAAFRQLGLPLDYLRLGEHPFFSLAEAVQAQLSAGAFDALVMLEAGDARVAQALQEACAALGKPLLQRPDPHFLCSHDEFARWAGDKAHLRQEFFYRWQRQRHGILMMDGQPVGGRWNYDDENRQAFGRAGPGAVPAPLGFAPDVLTQSALDDVERHFAGHPGALRHFDWPVTSAQAEAALEDFVRHRLADFGCWQDAMWQNEPFLWHSRLSAALNLKLIDPRRVIDAVLAAHTDGRASLVTVEGFVRQILGWREFVRGVYGRAQPALDTANPYGHSLPLPRWFWTAETQMNCLRQSLRQTLDHGYAHHIQRLMVIGNFALVAGLAPRAVADWFLAVYVDAVAWVEEPNTLGMALNAWPGMTSKPYCASGAYLKRMSNYCRHCRYRPEQKSGARACPVTVFYWDFLLREERRFAANPRMALTLKHLARLDTEARTAIADTARALREDLEAL